MSRKKGLVWFELSGAHKGFAFDDRLFSGKGTSTIVVPLMEIAPRNVLQGEAPHSSPAETWRYPVFPLRCAPSFPTGCSMPPRAAGPRPLSVAFRILVLRVFLPPARHVVSPLLFPLPGVGPAAEVLSLL